MLKSPKRKGSKLERWVAAELEKLGFRSHRVPGSGAFEGMPGDVRLALPDGQVLIECKHWRFGWRTGDSALKECDLLVIKRDFGEPAVYMPWKFFERLMNLAKAEEAARKIA